MANLRFSGLFQAIAKRLMVLLVSAMVLLGVLPTPALAGPLAANTPTSPNGYLALAASSRFAAQAEVEADPQDPTIPESRLEEMREQRREWQSEVSSAATDVKDETGNSVGEVIKDKLNLEEIVEDNEILDDIRNR
jgi:hypothetical protein